MHTNSHCYRSRRLMSVLFTQATIVLYDESPLEPDQHVLFKIAEHTKSTIMGMGAKLWDEYARMGDDFSEHLDQPVSYHRRVIPALRIHLQNWISSPRPLDSLPTESCHLRVY